MDPISQGALGAALPQSVSTTEKLRTFAWLGCLSGLAPDLDVFIRSATDPILFLEYHRQFTHALVFIPVGALICTLAFYWFARRTLRFRETFLACALGYGTHALLDACTTYGTMLLWPFSDARIAWNNVSVVDPLFTLPLLGLVITSVYLRRPGFARAGLLWALVYLGFGVIQRDRAEAFGTELAMELGHAPLRLEAKPGFANLFLWKIVYETETDFHVSAVRLFLTPKHFPGQSVRKLVVANDLPWLDPGSQQANDLARFDWFSNRYLALDPTRPNYVIDIRYSMIPNEIQPLWGILLDPAAGPGEHVRYVTDRSGGPERAAQLRQMLLD
ncbi:MAG: metal-dependent hydrolase [Pseudomonadota bacterium]